jgi:hypothetical protein
VTARGAHQPARRVGLQPALALATVPDAILGTEHPPPSLAVEDCQVAHRQPEGPRLQAAAPTFLDQRAVANLGIRERINSHAESIACEGAPRSGPSDWSV